MQKKPESQAKDKLPYRARFVESWGFEQATAYCSRVTAKACGSGRSAARAHFPSIAGLAILAFDPEKRTFANGSGKCVDNDYRHRHQCLHRIVG